MIKAGKYTAAILLVTVGSLLMLDLTMNTELTAGLLKWWPALLILIGLEYLLLSVVYRDPDTKLSLAVGSILMSVILSLAVIGFTQAASIDFFKYINSNSFGSFVSSYESGFAYNKGITNIPFNEGIDKITIDNPNGMVKMIAGDVAEIQIQTKLYVSKLKGKQSDEIADLSKIDYHENGKTLEIAAKGHEYTIFGVKQKPRMNLTITVPQNRGADFELDLKN